VRCEVEARILETARSADSALPLYRSMNPAGRLQAQAEPPSTASDLRMIRSAVSRSCSSVKALPRHGERGGRVSGQRTGPCAPVPWRRAARSSGEIRGEMIGHAPARCAQAAERGRKARGRGVAVERPRQQVDRRRAFTVCVERKHIRHGPQRQVVRTEVDVRFYVGHARSRQGAAMAEAPRRCALARCSFAASSPSAPSVRLRPKVTGPVPGSIRRKSEARLALPVPLMALARW